MTYLPTHPMDWKYLDEVWKAVYICCEMLIFLRRTTCYFYNLPIITAMSFTSLYATGIVGTLIAYLNA